MSDPSNVEVTRDPVDGRVAHRPWTEPWPREDVEAVGHCPVCGHAGREVLHREVVDNVLFCAPGLWALWKCLGCGCAYLDPRPTAASIHRAYENYHTHFAPSALQTESGLAGWKRSLKNGYKNWRFGTQLEPSTRLGVALARCLPSFRLAMDREFRHLPRVRGGQVLDVGFGGGAFLETAASAGWRAVGIDPDPQVVTNARNRGLNVSSSSIEEFREGEGTYDVITAAHVVEHVHDPASLLAHCFRLLKPGGVLWLETPNIDSLGHARFGRNWRGLEAPRHLAIFNCKSLRALLRQAGFADIRDLPQLSPCLGMFAMSDRMQGGIAPDQDMPIPFRIRLESALAEVLEACLGPSRKEFLAMIATKPA